MKKDTGPNIPHVLAPFSGNKEKELKAYSDNSSMEMDMGDVYNDSSGPSSDRRASRGTNADSDRTATELSEARL